MGVCRKAGQGLEAVKLLATMLVSWKKTTGNCGVQEGILIIDYNRYIKYTPPLLGWWPSHGNKGSWSTPRHPRGEPFWRGAAQWTWLELWMIFLEDDRLLHIIRSIESKHQIESLIPKEIWFWRNNQILNWNSLKFGSSKLSLTNESWETPWDSSCLLGVFSNCRHSGANLGNGRVAWWLKNLAGEAENRLAPIFDVKNGGVSPKW